MHNGVGTGIKSDPERVHPNIFECTNLSPAAYLRLRILICSNLKVYLSKSKMYFTKSKMYLSKKLIYSWIAKCICLNCQMYYNLKFIIKNVFDWKSWFVKMSNCICLNCKSVFVKIPNVFVNIKNVFVKIEKCICQMCASQTFCTNLSCQNLKMLFV